jgi:lipid-A-disaccharide synthase
MSQKHKKYRIFLSAADPSADSHCAGLIIALQRMGYDIEFVGVGGAKMAAAGCELLEYTVGRSSMMYKSFVHVAHFYKLIRRINLFLRTNKVDLVIVCDSPSFNFHVAKGAKRAGIKTLFYVAPQLWAWAGWRIHKLRRLCDKLCCILPFEQDWFSQRGIDTTFVGNPLLDKLLGELSRYKKDYTNFDHDKLKLALMPGSRSAEIESLWRPMQQIVLRIKKKYPEASFITVAVDAEREKILRDAQIAGFVCQYTVGSVTESAHLVDFALVASGSATLEVAAAGCPMVVMYQTSRILWYLVGWWLVRPKYFSLVNLLADKELVPEFMPFFSSVEPIVQAVEELLVDRKRLTQMSDDLIEIARPLTSKKASVEVAKIVIEMLR